MKTVKNYMTKMPVVEAMCYTIDNRLAMVTWLESMSGGIVESFMVTPKRVRVTTARRVVSVSLGDWLLLANGELDTLCAEEFIECYSEIDDGGNE